MGISHINFAMSKGKNNLLTDKNEIIKTKK